MSSVRISLAFLVLSLAAPATAQNRIVEVSFTPTARAQLAIWVETADGQYVRTLRLTEAVALRGIGNRPGALQMNSGFHWPYGRREGVLPIWAHARANAEGAEQFQRVIFQDRTSEGYASRTSNDASRDDYFCLSFNNDASSRDSLDATTCPSQFNSDKGRYLQEPDLGYVEPFEAERGGDVEFREMETRSLYPPRRDLPEMRGMDHPDSGRFAEDARAVMPEIDAVTMATLPGETRRTIQIVLPPEFADGEYILKVEVNVEGDYADGWDEERFPTPLQGGSMAWDFWAVAYGYPYRGQPSVLFEVPFEVSSTGGTWQADTPVGYGDIHGFVGDVAPMDGTIHDDPTAHPGSGADRLLSDDDGRLVVHVVPTNVCTGDDPPPQCFAECGDTQPCDEGFVCGGDLQCVGICDVDSAPEAPGDLTIEVDEERSWQYAHFEFDAPDSSRGVAAYQVRVATTPFEEGMSFATWGVQAKIASLEQEALVVPVQDAGTRVQASLGHLMPQTTYYVGIRATDDCGSPSAVSTVSLETTEIIFTTVSPCFVATAAYGTPMASEIGVLRRFRDRHLMSNAFGRALVDTYYEYGPSAADAIADNDEARGLVRTVLAPIVDLVSWIDE